MRKVRISNEVLHKLDKLADYMVDEFKHTEEVAMSKINRLLSFLFSLSAPANYAICRFKLWRDLGYRCVVFEKSWVFAYEIFDDGIIVRDMAHVATLSE